MFSSEKESVMERVNDDINGIVDIKIFMNDFLKKVESDPILEISMELYLKGRLKIKPERIYAFWNLLLFGEKGFKGKPFKHKPKIILQESHFVKLVTFFNEILDAYYEGPNVDLAKERAQTMANLFQAKMNEIKKQ